MKPAVILFKGMMKRKGVQVPSCRATVMETNAGIATGQKRPFEPFVKRFEWFELLTIQTVRTVLKSPGRPASRMS